MQYHIVVDNELEKVVPFQTYHWGFSNQKELNQIFSSLMKTAKVKHDFENFVVDVRLESKNLMVVYFNDWMGPNFEHAKIQQYYTERKNSMKVMDFRALPTCSLRSFVDISLRSLMIRKWFLDNVVKDINPLVMEKSSQSSGFSVKTSFGFISGYRKKVLIDYQDTGGYWARLVHTQATVTLVEENFKKVSGVKLYMGHPEDKHNNGIRYIDFFTDNEHNINLLRLIMDKDENLAFTTNITPLVEQLKTFELLHAI